MSLEEKLKLFKEKGYTYNPETGIIILMVLWLQILYTLAHQAYLDAKKYIIYNDTK